MKSLSKTLVLAAVVLATTVTFADTDSDVVVVKVNFSPDTYELYRDWAEKTLRTIEESASSDEREILVIGDTEIQNTAANRAWLRQLLTETGVPQRGGRDYQLSFLAPNHWPAWRPLLGPVLNEFYAYVKDPGVYEAKRIENDAEIEQCMAQQDKLNVRREAIELKKEGLLSSADLDGIRGQMVAIESAALQLDLGGAEAEARKRMILSKLGEERELAEAGCGSLEEQRRIVKRQIELAKTDLARAEQLYKDGLGAPSGLREAEKAILVLEKEAAVLAGKAQAEPTSVETQLRGLLTEAEIDLAGLEARSKVLEIRRRETEKLWADVSVLDNELGEVREQHAELSSRIRDLARRTSTRGRPYVVTAPDLYWFNVDDKAS